MMEEKIPDKILAVALKISEGKDDQVIDSIAREIEIQPGVVLLDVRRRPEINTTIIKFAGEVDTIINGLFPVCRRVYDTIDFRRYPEQGDACGAVSSLVFIPIRGLEVRDCKKIASDFAQKYVQELDQPVFFFGLAGKVNQRNLNEKIHGMTRDQISAAIQSGKLIPDRGKPIYHPEKGVTLVGVRKFIVTFILYLDIADLDTAQELAEELGAQSRKNAIIEKNSRRKSKRKSPREKGRFSTVETLATSFDQNKMTQLVCNLKDYENPTLVDLFMTAQKVGKKYAIELLGANIMGYLPLHAIQVAISRLPNAGQIQKLTFREQLNRLSEFLLLNLFGEFNPQWQIIDFRFKPFEFE